jgi:hypothetical protein
VRKIRLSGDKIKTLTIKELEEYLHRLSYIKFGGNVTISKEYLQSIVETAIENYYNILAQR